ncbi:hypothetical protein TorRG33x02_005950 [Trema orientale]|uniref:Uncharacterized protein n=1 Tax=Trema orientale TaxID=63057 RepID=A0A2P5G012_TREOI|nr:hypothetical protein TorRG33x02_005950 [Trema orientale]
MAEMAEGLGESEDRDGRKLEWRLSRSIRKRNLHKWSQDKSSELSCDNHSNSSDSVLGITMAAWKGGGGWRIVQISPNRVAFLRDFNGKC